MSPDRRPSKEKRGKDSRGFGWFSVLTVGVIVVSAGFTVGIIAGVTWEEPGLVFGWVTGDTDGIEWRVDEQGERNEQEIAESNRILENVLIDATPADPAPDVAAPPPLGLRNPEPSSKRERTPPPPRTAVVRKEAKPAPKPPRTTPVAATPAETGKFSVQVGAFSERAGADELTASLRKAGYTVYLSDSKRGARWRVRVGPHNTREEAEGTANQLENKQQLPTWVLREDS